MQALKDAGIVLVVILLAVSVRFSPLDEPGQEPRVGSLTPQTEAAAPPAERREPATPAIAAVLSTTPEDFSIVEWVLNESDEVAYPVEIDAAAVEQCTEVLIHIRKAAEQTRNEAIMLGAEEVVKVLPCSA